MLPVNAGSVYYKYIKMMIQNKDTFNINKVTIPFKKSELDNVISRTVINGYVATTYDMLIDTLKNISNATEYAVTLNPNTIFVNSNSPLERVNVLIRVEGIPTYKEFIDSMVQGDENESWSNFLTYSELFKDEIKRLKVVAYKKFLWNYHNIDAWFSEKNIGIVTDDKNLLLSDFDLFRSRVLESDDYISFIDCCLPDDLKNAIGFIVKNGGKLLTKYKVELNNHIAEDNKQQESIILKKPIITKIFLQSGAAGMCRKDWPKIKFTVLDKKSFDTIGLWD